MSVLLRVLARTALIGVVLSCVLVGSAGVAVSSTAADQFSFSGPIGLDRTGGHQNLRSVACMSGTQCTAVDVSDQEITFDPTAPSSPNPITIDPAAEVRARWRARQARNAPRSTATGPR